MHTHSSTVSSPKVRDTMNGDWHPFALSLVRTTTIELVAEPKMSNAVIALILFHLSQCMQPRFLFPWPRHLAQA